MFLKQVLKYILKPYFKLASLYKHDGMNIGFFILFIALFASLFSCGDYFQGDIQGFVKNDENSNGINGATVRLYLEKPENATAEGFFAKTTTSTSNGNDGFFRNPVIWQEAFPDYWPDRDTGMVYLGVVHEDYKPQVVEVPGILSDQVNIIEDVLLERASFSVPVIRGRAVNQNGEGVNGVLVVLDLASTTDDDRDVVVNTGVFEDEDGWFEFNDVTWKDQSAAGLTDTEGFSITVDDADWESADVLSGTLTSEQAFVFSDEVFSIQRQPRTAFQANLTGQIVLIHENTAGDRQEFPQSGIEVRISWDQDADSRLSLLETNGQGNFNLTIAWDDNDPGDYDAGDTVTPTSDPSNDVAEIPEMEDGLLVTIDLDIDLSAYNILIPESTSGRYDLVVVPDDPATTDVNESQVQILNFRLRSWINNNTLPAIEITKK